jgi:hypothetical protein
MIDETSDIARTDTVEYWERRATEAESQNVNLRVELLRWQGVADTLKQQRDSAEKERDALRKDAARLNWLESAHTLQNNVEILYVVDGYNVDVIHHNGATCHRSLHGATLREALDFARAAFAQEDA